MRVSHGPTNPRNPPHSVSASNTVHLRRFVSARFLGTVPNYKQTNTHRCCVMSYEASTSALCDCAFYQLWLVGVVLPLVPVAPPTTAPQELYCIAIYFNLFYALLVLVLATPHHFISGLRHLFLKSRHSNHDISSVLPHLIESFRKIVQFVIRVQFTLPWFIEQCTFD